MKMLIKQIFVLILLLSTSAFAMDTPSFFEQSNQFFQSNVSDGLVKYGQIKSNPSTLNELVNYISTANLDQMDDSGKLAFYMNAYNLYVIKQIIDQYPVGSPMDIEGFFDQKKITVAGEQLTLNDLENKKIRSYSDPRIHFTLVCAAMGCPRLGNFAFTPELVEEQLEMQTRLALNDPKFIRSKGETLEISEIFKWYRSDFGETDADLVLFLKKYRNNEVASDVKLSYYTYDWKLNDAK